jgi:hypothetical protein
MGGARFESLQEPTFLTEFFCRFRQYLQKNSVLVTRVGHYL